MSAVFSGLLAPPRWYAVLVSTNDACLALAAQGAPEGTVVAADRQTGGRGRQGRFWASPPGVGLYASLLLRPAADAGELTLLPLLAGVAVAEAILDVAGCAAQLKWPNDVLVNGRKVAGILVEADFAGDGAAAVVVGLGVNVATPLEALPRRPRYPATSLRIETGHSPDRAALLDAWRRRVARWYAPWQRRDTAPLIARWRELDALWERPVQVSAPDGTPVRGIGAGIDAQGALRVRAPDGGVIPVVAGDVLPARRRSERRPRGAPR